MPVDSTGRDADGSTGFDTTDLTTGSSSGPGGAEPLPDLPCTVVLEDDFDDAVLGSDWAIWAEPSGGGSVVESGDVVTASIPATDNQWTGIYRYADTFVGRAFIFEMGALPSEPDTYAFVEVSSIDKREIGIANGELVVRLGDPAGAPTVATFTHDPVEHRYLRLHEEAGEVVFASSADGVTWYLLHSMPTTGLSDPQLIGFGVGNLDTTDNPAAASLDLTRECS
jgi:hypothetical protein